MSSPAPTKKNELARADQKLGPDQKPVSQTPKLARWAAALTWWRQDGGRGGLWVQAEREA